MGKSALSVAILGGGIGGLSLALNLHKRGIGCRVYERAPELKPLGVGITLLPHAMGVFARLGLDADLVAAGIENAESCFYNRFGQLIYREGRGRAAGWPQPEVGIHRGQLHMILLRAFEERVGVDNLFANRTGVAVSQEGDRVFLHCEETTSGAGIEPIEADVVVACDGVNSAIRPQLFPDDKVVFTGINAWRGVTRHPPILTGRSYLRIGSIRTGKIVIYPIANGLYDNDDQLIFWTTEIEQQTVEMNDWNKEGRIEDFIDVYRSWTFPWLDVPELIRRSDLVLEYPMVDKNPLPRWSHGRLTLLGDAAHPMYPRGSNGAAQAIIDGEVLADKLAEVEDPVAALKAYEEARMGPTAAIVMANRRNPPDLINIKVEELVGDRPFDDLDRYITQNELRELSKNYARIAGFAASGPPAAKTAAD